MATIDFSNLVADMNRYVLGLQRAAQQAADDVAEAVHKRTVMMAKQDPSWQAIADEIELWSQDGKHVIGLKDQELASQAFQIEYGDETRAPSPLFRLQGRDLSDAFQAAFRTSGYGSYM